MVCVSVRVFQILFIRFCNHFNFCSVLYGTLDGSRISFRGGVANTSLFIPGSASGPRFNGVLLNGPVVKRITGRLSCNGCAFPGTLAAIAPVRTKGKKYEQKEHDKNVPTAFTSRYRLPGRWRVLQAVWISVAFFHDNCSVQGHTDMMSNGIYEQRKRWFPYLYIWNPGFILKKLPETMSDLD